MPCSFFDDYSESVHPEILKAIPVAGGEALGAFEQLGTYGNDRLCALASDRIRTRFGLNKNDAELHFVAGATHANLVVIASALRDYEGIISPATGHINVHEAGSIEATGRKILIAPSVDGKLTVENIDLVMRSHEDEHTTFPRAVYITQATEEGTVYTRTELEVLIAKAKAHNLYVILDGARLAMALASPTADMTFEWLGTSGIDAMVIGGTKVGGLSGEAIMILNPELRHNFRYHLKQRGALLAKAFFIGAQFARFFDKDDLWLNLGRESNERAQALASILQKHNIELVGPPQLNQVFAYMDNEMIDELNKQWGFYRWRLMGDGRWMVRLTTSWCTPYEAIEEFGESLA